MSHDNSSYIEHLIPDIHPESRPDFSTAWVYAEERQRDILSWFRSNISSEESLCVFYCKNGNPIDENGDRIIVGIGEVTKIHPILNYDTNASYTYPLWEVLFEHTIRRDLKESKGFLLPYHQYLKLDDKDVERITGLSKEKAIDEIKLTLDKIGNSERVRNELSYGCDYISNHSMLLILEAARNSVEAVIRHGLIGGDWERQLRWINAEIGRVKTMIVPFPSFAEVLQAIGVNYSHLIEIDIRKAGCGNKDNPWIYFEKLLTGNLNVGKMHYTKEMPLYRDTWAAQSKEIKELLILLSRFELDTDFIKELLNENKATAIIENPYIISETALKDQNYSVTTDTIDLGVMVDRDIQGECIPVPPSAVDSVLDKRRLRSMVIERLCWALEEGDTLVSIEKMHKSLQERLKSEYDAELPIDIILTLRDFFSSEIAYIPDNNPTDIQLKEYYEMERKLESVLLKRARKDVRQPLNEDWLSIVKSHDKYDSHNDISVKAAEQQAEALAMMSRRKLSVLAGGAGTGKTAVVRSFLKSETILNEGVLLLAPTGKARVRLGKEAEGDSRIKALTIAQFLVRHNRYEISRDNMRPVANPTGRKYSEARNIIIDECSMLTTKDLAVLIDALDPVRINRIILIGDPNQLPPIGAGRPFADLYNYLKRSHKEEKDKVLSGAVTHLEHVVRTVNGRSSDILNLASWFSNGKPRKEVEEIFDKIEQGNLDNDLKVYCWENEEDLIKKLRIALCHEFKCNPDRLGDAIKAYIGTDNIPLLKYHPDRIENLQILTPVLNPAWGAYALNERIQEWVRDKNIGNGLQFSTQIIHQGDKVMQLYNERKVGHPSSESHQLSNGQIGFVANNYGPWCNVVYSGIANETFGFFTQKGDEGIVPIELAYTISIHKSQGSDFDTVVVVLPKAGRIISRELIYTALTRAKKKVILLVEDNVHWLYEKSKPEASILATRRTNLFNYFEHKNNTDIPYSEGLIHRTKPDANGNSLIVRSKSEVIIANELISANLYFSYEKRLPEDYPKRYLPDFTFADDSGEIIIWEHLGMLTVPEYREAWERKKREYEKMGFVEGETLFTTEDHPNGSINTNDVLDVINRIKEIME